MKRLKQSSLTCLILTAWLLLAGCAATPDTPNNAEPTAEPSSIEIRPTPPPTQTESYPASAEPDRSLPTGYPAATPPPNDDPGAEESAGNADVTFVAASQAADGTWSFAVTVSHNDTGWEDYADGWDVVTPDGLVLKTDPAETFTRLLLHPHETEQPFTRSQGGLMIPADVTSVTVRAHDLVDGWGGELVVVDLASEGGENYTVKRR